MRIFTAPPEPMATTSYKLFKIGRGRFLVLENTDAPLSPYRATAPIGTPWAGARIGIGSTLLLSDETAEKMLAQGGIVALVPFALRPWREAYEEKQAARYEARKISRGVE